MSKRIKREVRIAKFALVACLMLMVINEFFRTTDALLVVFVLSIVVLGTASSMAILQSKQLFKTNLKTVMLAMAVLCFCLSLWTTHWPAKLRFQFSKTALVEFGDKLESGETISLPRTVGLYRVHRVTRRANGAICFWTSPDQSNFQGLAYCPDGLSMNIWSQLRLQERWHYIVED